MEVTEKTEQPEPKDPFIHSRGMKIPKHPDFTTGKTRGLLRDGLYERRECEAVLRVVRKGDTVLELGGGIGYMSTLIATRRNPAHVHSFEANPLLVPYIREVHAANGVDCATVHNALLAPRAGKARDFYVRGNFLASSMDRDNAGNIVSTHKVEVRSLPKTLKEIAPTVLVCDIEGAEARLLPAGDFSGLRAAVIELHPQWIGPEGVRAVFDAMHRAGLTYFPKASNAKVVTFRKDW